MTILAYLFSLPVLVALDLLWLGVVMKGFYQARLGHLITGSFFIPAAVAFYLLYALGMLYFVTLPAYANHSLMQALVRGFLLGVFAYATYDLTNMATLPNWPLSITVVDILWGGVISAALAGAGYGLLMLLKA